MNEGYGGYECGGLGRYLHYIPSPQGPQMMCLHWKPFGIECNECVAELGKYINKKGYYISKSKGNMS